ncbi:hypothetical protein [Aquimarina intermedia]|uniref:Uncharacterized protein n=1 Tax=Aquimarina intermedia TaxID=350814 RepID=A0A5S5C484_9FLAO|nr:hypothetical protein [Aquimarina intermedia]TYP72763.1 hypothetical protein BD809_10611 [Aquimarina intermedia]
MKKRNEDNEAKEIVRQLSCPEGEAGTEMGKRMDSTNAKMIRASIDLIPEENSNNLL